MISTSSTHRVAVVAMPGLLTLDFAIPIHAFDCPPYELVVCGEGASREAQAGATISPAAGLEATETADTVIVPGYRPPTERPSDKVVAALREAHHRGARIASICTGAFTLGYAGLLDHREATTHWMYLDTFAAEFPDVVVRRDVLYLAQGQVCTSAGVAAGIDLCLQMIRSDLGAAVANQRGRMLVAAPHRTGDQRQFVEHFLPDPRGTLVADTRTWGLQRLAEPLTLADMARHANMSTRNFSRRFIAETGAPPMRWLRIARVDRARELLESTDQNVEQIARQVGLGTRANFRRIFTGFVGVGPREYRQLYRP
jgi:transcriptional regulator GlxA family with amidase domain